MFVFKIEVIWDNVRTLDLVFWAPSCHEEQNTPPNDEVSIKNNDHLLVLSPNQAVLSNNAKT